MELIFIFLFGLAIGSFLNVVGLRWNSGIDLSGRSFCPVCHKKLHFWELIPVLSFFFLKGKCSKCKSKISWQYPLVELWMGLMFVTIFIVLSPFVYSIWEAVQFALIAGVFSIYVVIFIYDLRHKIIPDPLVYTSIALGILLKIILFETSIINWLAGPILFTFFGLIWLISKGRAMGFGDAKLGLSIGLLLGAAQGFSAIVLSFWIGALVSILAMVYLKLTNPLSSHQKGLTMKSEVPFAPFMILGAWLAFVYSLDIFHVLSFQ